MQNRPKVAPDLSALLPSWELALRAEGKTQQTVKCYGDGVRRFLAYCRREGAEPLLTRAVVTAFVEDLLEAGAESATVRARQLGVRRFSAWLTADGDYRVDPLLGLVAPKLEHKVVEPLRGDEVQAILATCMVSTSGDDASHPGSDFFRNRRDEAIIRLMVETGARVGEVVALDVDDLDLAAGRVTIGRARDGTGHVVRFGAPTAVAIDRYLRQARSGHRLAASPALWLGDRGKHFAYDGLHRSLKLRAEAAGVGGFHPHLLRRAAADHHR